jgi:hypothetical protein
VRLHLRQSVRVAVQDSAPAHLIVRVGVALGLLFPTFLGVGVDASMASELVRAGKSLLAARVCTHVGLFARVSADVSRLVSVSNAFHRAEKGKIK